MINAQIQITPDAEVHKKEIQFLKDSLRGTQCKLESYVPAILVRRKDCEITSLKLLLKGAYANIDRLRLSLSQCVPLSDWRGIVDTAKNLEKRLGIATAKLQITDQEHGVKVALKGCVEEITRGMILPHFPRQHLLLGVVSGGRILVFVKERCMSDSQGKFRVTHKLSLPLDSTYSEVAQACHVVASLASSDIFA